MDKHCWLRFRKHSWSNWVFFGTMYSIGDSLGYVIFSRECKTCHHKQARYED